MKETSIHITVNIPAPLYCELKQSAAASGRSIHGLILAGIKSVLVEGQRPQRQRVRFPLIVSKSSKVNVTNEQIYRIVPFP